MAAVAMAGKFNALRADQKIDAGAIKRSAEGIGVQRLTPLLVRFLVAMRTILRRRKGPWLDKSSALALGVPGHEGLVLAKAKIVTFTDTIGICFLDAGLVLLRAGGRR